MHEYPKVLRYDHPKLSDQFWEGDLILTEKTDGTNYRFTMYDDDYTEYYSDSVQSHSPDDRDIVVGTRRTVRGTDSIPEEEIEQKVDGALHRIYRSFTNIDKDKIAHYHDEFDSPIVWFAEGMVKHSLDYNYSRDPPPALLGFDVYVNSLDERDSVPANPFEQTFDGFLKTSKSFDMLEDIGVETVQSPNNLQRIDGSSFDPESYEIPRSAYADLTAEGIVIRNDAIQDGHRRAKIVSEEFEELNRKSFGYNEKDAETPEERFVAIFCTEGRIRKVARKMVITEGVEFTKSIIDDLWRRVYDDIWDEEYAEIKELNFGFNPSKIKPIIAEQVAATVERMMTNAELNDTRPTNIWRN